MNTLIKKATLAGATATMLALLLPGLAYAETGDAQAPAPDTSSTNTRDAGSTRGATKAPKANPTSDSQGKPSRADQTKTSTENQGESTEGTRANPGSPKENEPANPPDATPEPGQTTEPSTSATPSATPSATKSPTPSMRSVPTAPPQQKSSKKPTADEMRERIYPGAGMPQEYYRLKKGSSFSVIQGIDGSYTGPLPGDLTTETRNANGVTCPAVTTVRRGDTSGDVPTVRCQVRGDAKSVSVEMRTYLTLPDGERLLLWDWETINRYDTSNPCAQVDPSEACDPEKFLTDRTGTKDGSKDENAGQAAGHNDQSPDRATQADPGSNNAPGANRLANTGGPELLILLGVGVAAVATGAVLLRRRLS